MGFWDSKTDTSNEENQNTSFLKAKADAKSRETEESLNNAFLMLGKTVFEAEKENVDSKYFREIKEIKQCQENESLWTLYKLSLEGKTKCDSCGAIITSDSAFCNKCGAVIPPRDFSSIGIGTQSDSEVSGNANVCPNCGKELQEGAVFCEKCGTKIDTPEKDISSVQNTQLNDSCPKCGAKLVSGAIFCEKCGYKLA